MGYLIHKKFLSLKLFSRNLARDNNNGDENNDKSKQAMVAFANFDLLSHKLI